MKPLLILTCVLPLATLAQAQVQINLSQAYTQSFDTLANTGTGSVTWTNNGTLPGWYAYRASSGALGAYRASTGPESTGIASFGLDGNTDRAFGTGINTPDGDSINFGVQFANNTGTLITGFSVEFDGEQWQRMSNFSGGSDSLTFSYQVFNSGLGSISAASGWTSVDALTFTSPTNSGVGFESLNGNLDANRAADISSFITGVSLGSGQELWIRWTATNLPTLNDHSLAIDNLTVSFATIPEPSTYALALGALALVGTVCRRSKR